MPFFRVYDAQRHINASPSSDEGIYSITLRTHDAVGSRPLVFTAGEDLQRLLSTPVREVAAGELLEMDIFLRANGTANEEASPPQALSDEATYNRALDRARRANNQRRLTVGAPSTARSVRERC